MFSVWIFDISISGTDIRDLVVPKGTKFLHVNLDPDSVAHAQYDVPAFRIWGLVDTTRKDDTEYRRIRISGTGHPLSGKETYIGSILAPPFIWHVFELSLK